MMQILPNRCVPIGKKEILYMGSFGIACWLSGVIFIDRKKREESIAILTEVAHTMRKDNVSGTSCLPHLEQEVLQNVVLKFVV